MDVFFFSGKLLSLTAITITITQMLEGLENRPMIATYGFMGRAMTMTIDIRQDHITTEERTFLAIL